MTAGSAAQSSTVALPQAGSRSAKRPRNNDLLSALLFIAPAAFGFVTFSLFPALRGVYLSLTQYKVLTPPRFIGLANYEKLVSDSLFWNAVAVTGEYVVINVAVQTVVALALAVLMHRLTQSVIVRGIILLPYLTSNVVVALLWFLLLDYQVGIVNETLQAVGLPRVPFYGNQALVIPTIAITNIWRFGGYTALLIFAGLQTIPKQYYEAAVIDGASEWQIFWRVTLPLLRPVMALVLVVSVIGSFQVYDNIAVTTKGGPVNATRVLSVYIYDLAFARFQFGYASAISVVLLVVLAVVGIVQLRLLRADKSDLA